MKGSVITRTSRNKDHRVDLRQYAAMRTAFFMRIFLCLAKYLFIMNATNDMYYIDRG